MRPRFLSFHTTDRAEAEAWSPTGLALLHRLGGAVEALGYEVDYEAGRQESDWLFAARRGGRSFAVVLGLLAFDPCRWFTWLEGADLRPLDAPDVTHEVHPAMQAAIAAHPGATHLRWHQDNTTLREV